jgi:hypothetical protein
MKAFIDAVVCVSHGICLPDEAKTVISRYHVAFISDSGMIRLVQDKSLFVEAETNGRKIITTDYDMFVLKDGKEKIYSPRLVINSRVYTVDEFIDFVRRGFRAILSAANWV